MNAWRALRTVDVAGSQRARLEAWRHHRLWFMAESGFLIDGFESRPGTHPWQGEHLGKWLHAATLTWLMTGEDRLRSELGSNVKRLLATQLPNGYLGTYGPEETFVALPENVVEGCCDTTWIQLCLHLFEALGDASTSVTRSSAVRGPEVGYCVVLATPVVPFPQ